MGQRVANSRKERPFVQVRKESTVKLGPAVHFWRPCEE